MHPRRKRKSRPADHDIFVEVMEPRVLLSADALGIDSSVFDRDLQTQSNWDLTVASHWWAPDSKDTLRRDLDDPTATNPKPSGFSSFSLQELSHEGVSPTDDRFDALSLTPSIDDRQNLYRQIVFLDTGVIDGELLLSDLLRNTDTATTQVYLIDSSSDGVEQISSVLDSHQDLDAVHIISHGTAGQVQLGSGTLSSTNVESYTNQLNLWGRALAESGDILIYGCDLANDSEGQALVDVISSMTRADVAASVDQTGSTEQGGDWELEYQRGDVETVALASSLAQDWSGTLALINVTTFDDIDDGGDTSDIDSLITTPGTDGISLREAIIATNNDAGQADTITLSAGTYSLALAGSGEDAAATGDLDILDALTITGAGADQTFIDAAGLDRVFQVIASSVFNVSISDLAIQNGLVDNRGAGIHIGNLPAAPVVNLDSVLFSGNHTTGTSDFGGAIFNRGDLTVVDSLIEGNSSEFGGGVMNFTNGILTMTNTTISGNSATAGDGGGLYNLSVATLSNVTVAENSASGGGGGLYNKDAAGAITNINNTLVANNTASSSPDIYGAFVSNGGNLVKTLGSVTGLLAGDIQGNDPRLTPLGDYGGMTQTHALQAGSLAINPGTVTGEPAADQRGILRDAQADIGAFEATANILIVDTLSGAADAPDATTIDNLLSNVGADGKISLNEAIMATNGTANLVGGPDEIRFQITDALVGGAHTINVAAGGLQTITEAVMIDGTTDADYVDSPIIELNGTAAGSNGLNISGDGSTIRGLLINNFNSGHGIEITGDNNRIESSYIGIDVTGNTDLGNAHLGIRISSASGNYIGGAGVGNVISGNSWAGIAVVGSASDNNFIQSNLIGTNAAGTSAIGNGNYGIDIWSGGPSNTTIGGTNADLRNVVSGNLWAGIHISGTNATGNQMQGNYIGTDITGTVGIGNGSGGISIDGGANANTIGGTVDGANNLIANNTGPGVWVGGATALGNAIQENEIHSNTGIGIELTSDGNEGRQPPSMTTITTDGAGQVAIDGSYSDPAMASQTLTIEYFSNPSNTREGRIYLDSDSFTTNGSGSASFSSSISALVSDGEYVSATVTDSSGNTSEFSLGRVAVLAVNNAPAFLSSGPFNVDEGAAATTVVGNVDADDGDGGAADAGITYSITSNVNPDADGNNAFAIDSSSGQITVNDAGDLDFEDMTPLVITVQADDGVLTNSTDVTINLDDVAPTLAVTGAANVSAGQTYTLDLTATEPGTNGITSYTVNWGDGNVTTEAYTGPTTSVSHVYDDAGFTYHITFAANDVSDTWTNSDLNVTSWDPGNDDVFVFDGISGDAGGLFNYSGNDLDQPYGIAVGPDGNFYVAGFNSNNIVSYAADGSYLGIFSTHGQLNNPSGLAWGGDGNLYVANFGGNNILRIDAGGTFIDIWGVGGALNGPEALAFSPDGDLYVSSSGNNRVVVFDGVLGGAATTVINSGLSNPEQIVFDGAGNLYIANSSGNDVLRWDGAALTSYFTHPDLSQASGLAFGPDGLLYVSSFNNDKILRYDGVTGEVFADSGSGGLDKPTFIAFTPDHQVTTVSNNAPAATNLITVSSYNEGDASVAISNIVVSDGDAAEVITATLTLANTATGSLTANDGATYTAGTGVWTITDSVTNVNTALANLAFSPVASNDLDTTILVNIDDGDEDASGALTGIITLDVIPTIGGAITTQVPGAQNTNEDSALVFSTGSGNTITVDDGTAGDSVLRTELSVTNGILTLNTAAGLSFESGADGTSSMTIIGLESAINTALDGLTYTPSLNYDGLANLQLTTDSQADLQGFYSFTQPGALGEDTSSGGANVGTPSVLGTAPDPYAVFDSDRGSGVLVLDGVDDNIQIAGRFGTPNNMTMAAWVNVPLLNNQEVVSIGNSIALRLNDSNTGTGVTGYFNDGSGWKHTDSGRFIGGDGWHHVAFTFDDVSNTQVIYIDGIALGTTHHAGSINWALEPNTTIGSHPDEASYWLSGMMDDARIYDRALTPTEIQAIANDSGTAIASITVDPVNDAPLASGMNSTSTYNEGDTSVAISDIVVSDVDTGELITATLTLANTTIGILSATDGATYTPSSGVWTITDTVAGLNTALANLEFSPAINNDLDTAIFISMDDGDEDGSGALTGTINLDATPVNDEQVLAINRGVTVDEGSVGTVIDNTLLHTNDVDNNAAQLIYTVIAAPGNGAMKLSGSVVSLNDNFSQDDIDTGKLTYDHDGSETTNDSFEFSVDDGSGSDSNATFNISVTAQNNEQVLVTNFGPAVLEGSEGSIISAAMLNTTDVDNTADQLVYTVTAVPENGTLKLGASALALNDAFTQDDIDNSRITYDHDGSETTSDGFNFSVDDGAGTASTGTFSVVISAQNDEQILFTNAGTAVIEGSVGSIISATMLTTTDADNTAVQLVYTVTAVPENGTLKLSGAALALNGTFTQDDIDNGRVTYDHDGSWVISDYFDFSVDDGVGSASTGSFNIAVARETLVPQTINPVGNKVLTEGVVSNVQLASSVETTQNASAPTEETESKSDTEISIDEEQTDAIVTVADIQYQFTTANSVASTNAVANSPPVALIAQLLQTPAIAGLLAAPYEFDALSLEINQILTSYEFNESMDSLRKDLDDSKFLRGTVVGSSVAVTTGLSVGYVAWMVRGGVLLSSVLSSLPAWQFIDPLPVLNFSEKEEEGDEQDDSLEDIIADHAKTTDVPPVSEPHEKPIRPADPKETHR